MRLCVHCCLLQREASLIKRLGVAIVRLGVCGWWKSPAFVFTLVDVSSLLVTLALFRAAYYTVISQPLLTCLLLASFVKCPGTSVTLGRKDQ